VKLALREEQEWFENHPIYQTMPSNCLGTSTLTAKCTKIMFTHIKSHLPDIIKEIKDKIQDIESRLVNLGPPMPSEAKDKSHLLWNMITEFIKQFKDTLGGKQDNRGSEISRDLKGGAKIKEFFELIYKEYVAPGYKATYDY
jgi:hypothetical protein